MTSSKKKDTIEKPRDKLNLTPIKQLPETTGKEEPRSQLVRPIASVKEALAAWKEYQALKEELKDKGDFVEIKNKKTGEIKLHPTKQFANKLRKFFGLSLAITKEELAEKPGKFTWYITVRATAPTGQYNDADGSCCSDEKSNYSSHKEHDVRATAVTRAKNRAILELAGFGEVSAEEIGDQEIENKPEQRSPAEMSHPDEKPLKTDKSIGSIKTKLEDRKIDIKEFKNWLFDKQKEMNRKFLGRIGKSLRFHLGNPIDVEFLDKNLNDAIGPFLSAKVGAKTEEKPQENTEEDDPGQKGDLYSGEEATEAEEVEE